MIISKKIFPLGTTQPDAIINRLKDMGAAQVQFNKETNTLEIGTNVEIDGSLLVNAEDKTITFDLESDYLELSFNPKYPLLIASLYFKYQGQTAGCTLYYDFENEAYLISHDAFEIFSLDYYDFDSGEIGLNVDGLITDISYDTSRTIFGIK